MGMSIENAIKHGQEQLEIFGGEHREFIETSLDTMRKYQKIAEIVSEQGMPEWSYQRYMEIAGIIRGYKNGNDN